jgi:hypothetical protein
LIFSYKIILILSHINGLPAICRLISVSCNIYPDIKNIIASKINQRQSLKSLNNQQEKTA